MEMPTEMQHQAMGYDRAATMFSPDGHLLQVEYAEKTVRLGSSSIGLNCKDGVVIIADKRVRDKLIAPESQNKIFEVDNHIIGSSAGITSDARVLVDMAQVLSQQNKVTYDSPVEPITIIKAIADKKQAFTQYGGARPFGVAIMIAGSLKNKGYLYTTDITGNYTSYKATAIGENDEKIKEILRREFKEELNVHDGIKFGLKIFKDILDKNFEISRFELAFILNKEEKITRFEGEEIKKFLK